MSLRCTLLISTLLGSGLPIGPPVVLGQVPASDSAAQAAVGNQPSRLDTVRAASDSLAVPGSARDTTPRSDSATVGDTANARDTAIGGDTAATARDTAATVRDTANARDTTSGRDSTPAGTTSDTAAASRAPGDSILATACAGETAVGRDLLVIVFAPEASSEERTAAVKAVNGRLLGPVSLAEPGAYYLLVPTAGEESRLRGAADQLIQLIQVRQVGSRACPPFGVSGETRQ